MGADFAIDVEPRQPSTTDISEAEIEAQYRIDIPSGEPPLAAIREHVVRAIALQRAAGQEDAIEILHRRFVDDFGRLEIWFNAELDDIARERGVTPLSQFLRERDGELIVGGDYVHDSADEEQAEIAKSNAKRRQRILDRGPARDQWCDPADGLRTVHALQAELPRRRAGCRRELDCLVVVEKILSIACRERRRWRLLAFW